MDYQRRAIAMTAEFETREVDGQKHISGYFAVFGSQYQLWADAVETIDPGAFDLAADKDVRALTNHDTTLVLGRTTAGTLLLQVDDHGLWGDILINEADQDAVNLYERVRRRDVTQCSFGFDIIKELREETPNGITAWHLQSVKLWEVSVCTFPAYQETAVEARKQELAQIQKRKTELWREQMHARLKGE